MTVWTWKLVLGHHDVRLNNWVNAEGRPDPKSAANAIEKYSFQQHKTFFKEKQGLELSAFSEFRQKKKTKYECVLLLECVSVMSDNYQKK